MKQNNKYNKKNKNTVTRYRISQVRLDLGESKEVLPEKIIKKLGKKGRGVRPENIEIIRESVDARKKNDIHLVYTLNFDSDKKLELKEAPDLSYKLPEVSKSLEKRPVIVGFGPCGMFCALVLARCGLKPLVLERGSRVDDRVRAVKKFWEEGVLDPDSNVQFGEGGAGTFSDGKLTTGIKDPRIRFVLEEFVRAGADPDILYQQKPHIGTDVLRKVVKNIRGEIIHLGGEIRFNTKMTGIVTEEGSVRAVKTVETGLSKEAAIETTVETDSLVLAIGHSSRDTFRMLKKQGVSMEQKAFSIGVRIEHPQEMVDRAQYGRMAGHPDLPTASYKLVHHCKDGRGVYTFCMCPGGHVIMAASQPGRLVTNGMSFRNRASGMANSALLVDVRTSDFETDDVLAGVYFQEKYEELAFLNGGSDWNPPKTEWKEFREGSKGAEPVINSLPRFAVESIREAMPYLGRRLRDFDSDNALMTAVETRSSSPVRILRDRESMQGQNLKGFYPAGEGCGYAGGITSAACDGIKIAEKIVE